MARVALDEKEISDVLESPTGLAEATIVSAEYQEGKFFPQLSIRTDLGFLPGFIAEFRKVTPGMDAKEAKSVAYRNGLTRQLLINAGNSAANVDKVLAGKGLLVLDLKNPVPQDGLDDRRPDDVLVDLVGRKLHVLYADKDTVGDKYGKIVLVGAKAELARRFNAQGGATNPVGAVLAIAKAEGVPMASLGDNKPKGGNRRAAQREEEAAPVSGDAGGAGGEGAPTY